MRVKTRTTQPTPLRMVGGGRVTAFGCFDRPFENVNILDADIYGAGAVGRSINRLRLKEWQHFAVFGPDFMLTFVVLNAHYLASSFCYFVDREQGAMVEHHREGPPFAARLASALWDDRCRFRMKQRAA